MKSVCIHTVGCKLNYSESSFIAKKFTEKGLVLKPFGEKADIFVLNTCTVTSHADSECRRIIRSVLRKYPETFVAVIGCYSQLNSNQIAGIKGVDLILGTNEKFKIVEHIEKILQGDIKNDYKKNGNRAEIYISDFKSDFIGEAYSSDSDVRTRAFLKIQDGCDYNCAFCTVPLARGRSRSLPIQKVLENAKHLIDAGYKEIILTGVNIGDYKVENGSGFLFLMEQLERLDIERIRISSIEPNLLTNDIIKFIRFSDKFCNHFHIPLQSGDDEILKLMKRRYNVKMFEKVIESIKSKIPDAGIGIDVIVGFPNEGEKHFKNTYNFIQNLPVSYLHIFSYSERKNTLSSTYEGKVPAEVKKERSKILRELSIEKKIRFYNENIQKVHRVLFETWKNGFIEGWTENYVRVRGDSKLLRENEILPVLLTKTNENNLVECKLIN
ncbi:MAG: tRNA (N(6)-L-threonylcarbamoyladenosine(37)-C(2))-methylthiotransferase MtaB [Ignavibacteria bacterium]|nr:tRNA (N(6)-L-threonylcarbamoyladenosine(37)-C(2))-methylthiotransferase MtaB [Ignavibacteria bacterium]